MTAYLDAFFRDLDVSVDRQMVFDGRENVVARYRAPGSRRTILFDAHQDTVPIDGMTIEPFVPRVEGNRLYGRGACDIKGGMAAMLTAFARLVRERPRGSASVIIACTVDEEFTHKGSSYLAEHPTEAEVAIVTEPTMLDVVNCHKGAIRWKIRTRGVACHSSRPELGDNAIYRMAPLLSALADYAASLARSNPDPVLGPPTFSIGRIEGGQSVNVVPDWCEIEVDRRLIPGEDALQCKEEVRQVLQARAGSLDSIEISAPWINFPALSSHGSERWVEAVCSALAGTLGRRPKVAGVPYGTDAGALGATGLPCLVFGPGDIAQAHTKDEWADLDQVRTAAEAYYQIACALGA
jgi:acetylornithine deacetylase